MTWAETASFIFVSSTNLSLEMVYETPKAWWSPLYTDENDLSISNTHSPPSALPGSLYLTLFFSTLCGTNHPPFII
jgi:hypothetical protein